MSSKANSGQIQLILGPMFSGKTTELMRRVRRYTCAKHKCVVVKYKNDTRYSEECASTHDRQTIKAVSSAKLSEVAPSLTDADVVAIDEGSFFPDIVEFCETQANLGRIVIVAALDGTYERKPFGSILQLIPLSEQVNKLSAVCMICHKEAAFSKRLGTETAVEVIGGADKYLATCRDCYLGERKDAWSSQTGDLLPVTPQSARAKTPSPECGSDSEPEPSSPLTSPTVSSADQRKRKVQVLKENQPQLQDQGASPPKRARLNRVLS